MKLFKYFTYKELKEICNKLDDTRCHYRHPQSDFIKYLGNETVNKLISVNFLKDSLLSGMPWDYSVPCYEFSNKFKIVFNYLTTPFWLWFKIYILRIYWFRHKWQAFRIWCGHHYDWQDYEGVSLNEI